MPVLTQQEYDKFEKELGMSPVVPKDGVDAAYRLGVQYVLKQMREKLIHG